MAELTAYQPASSVADPSLTVTGRDDGGGYTVTAGARSLSISTDAGATLLTTVKDQDNAAVTVTDATSTTPSWTAPAGSTTGAGCCVTVTSTVGSVSSQVSFIEHVDGSGGGGGGPTRLVDIDFTSDVTDLTLTMNGGDTNLRNAADTATKAIVGAYDRIGSPTATIAITAANGGAKITSQGASLEANMYTRLVAATEGFDFSDPSRIYMVSCLVTGQVMPTNNDTIGVWISPAADFNNVNGSWGGQQYRTSGTSFGVRGIRYLGGGFGVGSELEGDASIRSSMVVTFILYKGRLADVYITDGTTIPSTFPVTGAALFKMDGGADAVAVEQTFNLYSTNLYVHGQVNTAAAANAEVVIERITVDEWDL